MGHEKIRSAIENMSKDDKIDSISVHRKTCTDNLAGETERAVVSQRRR